MTQQELDKIIQDSHHNNTQIVLKGAQLVGCNMYGIDMRWANMQEANMREADMREADMQEANMRWADMREANMRWADMQRADMRGANMREADMRGADIDYAGWPLWCGSLRAYIDDRIAIQLLYHVLSPVCYSPYVSDALKQALLTPELVAIANRFHRVAMGDCEKLPTDKKRAARDAGTSTSGKQKLSTTIVTGKEREING